MSDVKRKQQTYSEFLVAAERLLVETPGLRRGQAYMNQLALDDWTVCDLFLRTFLDPFYDDDRLEDFLTVLVVIWPLRQRVFGE